MRPYLDLLRDVLHNGRRVPTRATLPSTGETVDALSVFGRQVRYDLTKGFPAVTTKELNFDAVVHELVWMLSGDTTIDYLNEHGIHIWDQWADDTGDLGPIYGEQWRDWYSPSITGNIDQIRNLESDIRRVADNPSDPVARRLILSAWSVADLPEMRLPPCHVLAQFHVSLDGRLSCQMYQRSCDLFIGAPFNVASYALLTGLFAHVTDLGVGEFVHTVGDAHIYINHLDLVQEQLSRNPKPLPWLVIDDGLEDIDDFERKSVALIDYQHHPALRGEVAV